MATKSDFELHEWQLLSNLPRWIYSVLITAKGGTDEITRPEAKAMSKFLEDYHPGSQLLQSILANKITAEIPGEISSSPYEMGLRKIEQIGNILPKKLSPQEMNDLKEFSLSLAQAIARASGEGFLGLGKKISDKENKAIEAIANALKAPKVSGVEREGAEAAEVEQIYEVKPGDSLSKIALSFYGDTSQWPKIFE